MHSGAVIIGAFEFVGFHLCKALLEKGYKVAAIHTNFSDRQESDFYVDEKMLEIGRNANFSRVDQCEIGNIENDRLVFIDLYSSFLYEAGTKEKLLEKLIELRDVLSVEKTLVIMPLQWKDSKYLKEIDDKAVFIFLPTIYGEWQPNEFIFQQALIKELGHRKDIAANIEEWADAIYAGDAAAEIISIAIGKENGSWLLRNADEQHWQECADFLKIDRNKLPARNMPANDCKEKVISSSSSIEHRLKAQKRQLQYLLF